MFGTDGIRGVANIEPMTCDTIQKLGLAIASVLGRSHRPKVVIGKDTRLSGYMFETALASGVVAAGGRVRLTGPLPTPGIAFLTSSLRCDAGVVVSASHNPYCDNGIKIFGRDGFKLPDETEAEIAEFIESGAWKDAQAAADSIGGAKRFEDSVGRYVVHCKSTFPRDFTLDGLNVVLDTANGAAYRAAPLTFRELGARVTSIHSAPNGRNINEACGALHPQDLAASVVANNAQLGIALDGDADRLVLVDEKGEVVDGDEVLAMCALRLAKAGKLPHRTVVATVMSNIGLERALADADITLERTQVGDRFVMEAMRAGGYTLGGEQSGHLIFLEYGTTGDGIVAALQVLALMIDTGKPLSELRRAMTRSPQVLTNVIVKDKPPIASLDSVTKVVSSIEAKLGREGRVLLRYSGTEPKARVMLEGPKEDLLQDWAEEIAYAIKQEIGAE